VLLWFFLVISLVSYSYASPYPKFTGNSLFDANAVGSASLSILVDALFPNVTIILPNSSTKSGNTSILLLAQFYEDRSLSSIFFNLDNTTNITLTLNSTNGTSYEFNTSIGHHRLYVFVNDSVGNINHSSVFFYVDFNTSFNRYQTKFNGSSSTNLTGYTNQTLNNVSNFTLETISRGKIDFLVDLNLTNFTTANIDIDMFENINITQNNIFLNSTRLKTLNKTANLTLYGITFTTPRILRDNELCPASICTSQTYSGGNLTFTVTGFSTYSSEETPVENVISAETARTGEGPIEGPRKPVKIAEEIPPSPPEEFGPRAREPTFIEKIIRRFTGKEEKVPIESEKQKPIIEYPTEIIVPVRNLLSAIMTMAVILLLFLAYTVIRGKIVSKKNA